MDQSNSVVKFPSEGAVEIRRVFAAPPSLVFKMWSDPEHMVRWHGPEGCWLTHCEQDFREGGNWRRCMSHKAGHAHWIHGEFREIRPFSRLSFTYINEYDGHETLVEMDFSDLGAAGTEMVFLQSNFASIAERDGHARGWTSSLELFAAYLLLFAGKERDPIGRPRIEGVTEDIAAARSLHEEKARGDVYAQRNR